MIVTVKLEETMILIKVVHQKKRPAYEPMELKEGEPDFSLTSWRQKKWRHHDRRHSLFTLFASVFFSSFCAFYWLFIDLLWIYQKCSLYLITKRSARCPLALITWENSVCLRTSDLSQCLVKKARYLAWTKTIGCTIRKNGRVCSRHFSQESISSKDRLLKTL